MEYSQEVLLGQCEYCLTWQFWTDAEQPPFCCDERLKKSVLTTNGEMI